VGRFELFKTLFGKEWVSTSSDALFTWIARNSPYPVSFERFRGKGEEKRGMNNARMKTSFNSICSFIFKLKFAKPSSWIASREFSGVGAAEVLHRGSQGPAQGPRQWGGGGEGFFQRKTKQMKEFRKRISQLCSRLEK